MSETSLTISFTGDSQSATVEDRFVHLEQIDDDGSRDTVSMYDIQQMVARAKAGMSARTYKLSDCAAYIDGQSVVVDFDFYVWPSSIDLLHTISSSIGEVSPPEIIDKSVEFSVTFEMSDVVEFDFMLSEITSYSWETGCYDADGQGVEPGELVIDGMTTVRIDRPVFGVVRIKAKKKGAQHSLDVRLVKYVSAGADGSAPTEDDFEESGANSFYTYQEWLSTFYSYTDIYTWNGIDPPDESINLTGLKITSLNATVTAHWVDINGDEVTESLTMEVPQCVEDLLTMCGDGDGGDGDEDEILNPGGGLDVCGDAEDECKERCDEQFPEDDGKRETCREACEPQPNVYVSSCTGEVLDVRYPREDPDSWCGQ